MKQFLQGWRTSFLQFIFLSWLLVLTQAACVQMPRRNASPPGQNAPTGARSGGQSEPFSNINTATRAELEKLPGIGVALATRIIEHREKYGRFRRVEHLLMVRGISERRLREMSALLTTE